MGRKSALDLQAIVQKVVQHSWELLLHPLLQQFGHAFELREIVRVDQSPVLLLHQLDKAPEYRLFVVWNIEKQKADKKVNTLHVAHFIIVVSVGFEDVVELVLPVFVPQIQICQRTIYVFIYLIFNFLIVEIA